VNWAKLKRGELVSQSRFSFSLTTVIPDVIVDVIEKCESIDSLCSIEMLHPNGFTTATFDIAIHGKGFQVNCGRRLVRGLFPLNPIAAEFGSNYDVLVTIATDHSETENELSNVISDKYECKKALTFEQSDQRNS
jgi:hypothetical protein